MVKIMNILIKYDFKELEEQKKDGKAFQEREQKTAQKELNDAQKELEQLKGTFTKTKESLASLRCH